MVRTITDINDKTLLSDISDTKPNKDILQEIFYSRPNFEWKFIPEFNVINVDKIVFITEYMDKNERRRRGFAKENENLYKDFTNKEKRTNILKKYKELYEQNRIKFEPKKINKINLEAAGNIQDLESLFYTLELNTTLVAIGYNNKLKIHQSVTHIHKKLIEQMYKNLKKNLKGVVFQKGIILEVELKTKNIANIVINTMSITQMETVPLKIMGVVNEIFNIKLNKIEIKTFDLVIDVNRYVHGVYDGEKTEEWAPGQNNSIKYMNTNEITVENIDDKNSRLHISNVKSIEEGKEIVKLLIDHYNKIKDNEIVFRQVSKIKMLKEMGMKFNSRICQLPRQPVLYDENNHGNLQDHRKLEWKNDADKSYMLVCPSTDYQYPILTELPEKHICCFKTLRTKDVKGKKSLSIFSELKKKNWEEGRLAHIPETLRTVLGIGEDDLYRLGLGKSDTTFIQSVEALFDDTDDAYSKMSEYLKKHPGIYDTLDHGRLKLRYTLKKYMLLLSEQIDVLYTNYIDLLSIVYGVNIIFLETKANIDKNKHFTEIYCNIAIDSDKYIIILMDSVMERNKKYFYPLVKRGDDNVLVTQFDKKNLIINKLVGLREKNCTSKFKPISTTFPKLKNYNDFVKAKLKVKVVPIAQVLNDFNQVIFLQIEHNILIPVNDEVNPKLIKINLRDIEGNNELLGNCDDTIALYGVLKIPIKGVTLDDKNKNITSIVTEYNVLVPVKTRSYLQDNHPPSVEFKYYNNIEEKSNIVTKYKSISTRFKESMNEIIQIMNKDKDLVKKLTDILKQKKPRHAKIHDIEKVLLDIKDIDQQFLEMISQNIVNDPNMTFLSKKQELVKRNTEYIIESQEDLDKFFIEFNLS